MNELATWARLLRPELASLREAADQCDPQNVADVARLRRKWDGESVHAALALTKARRKAADKFPGRAESFVADPEGLEQASSLAAARHKARRFSAVTTGAVVDLACGIGGDALGFVEAGPGALAVDASPLRAWMAGRNAGCSAVAGRVEDLFLRGRFCHLDPSRRRDGRRRRELAEALPGPAVVERVINTTAGLGVKLSPAVDADELPWRGELEFISEEGRLVQAVLWTGALAGGSSRTASRIDAGGDSISLTGEPGAPPIESLGQYVFAVDPAVERAGLMAALCEQTGTAAVHPKLGLVTADRPVASNWLRGFELVSRMTWQRKRVKHFLAVHDAGPVEVKTRGRAVDPDVEQQQLKGNGSTPFTVFVLRWDRQMIALITRRLAWREEAPS
jgi:hypothetical protein